MADDDAVEYAWEICIAKDPVAIPREMINKAKPFTTPEPPGPDYKPNPKRMKEMQEAKGPGKICIQPSPPPGWTPPKNPFGSEVKFPQTFPFSCVGLLIATDKLGDFYSGSASVIGDTVVMTAAHCVWDKNNNCYFKNFTFFPGWTPAKESLGQFTASK